MCGIVGYLGMREAAPILLGGLKRLEYRGYDSAGIAVANGAPSRVLRRRGKLAELERLVAAERPDGNVGIGHTRWATHGRPSDSNAHPHKVGGVSVVHNGIIENHLDLRRHLEHEGRAFQSETDTEIVAHLIDRALGAGASSLVEAVVRALAELRGAYAIVVMSDAHHEEIVAAKNASPLVIGYGAGETFLASDVPALLEHTRDVLFVDEGEIVDITRAGAEISRFDGAAVTRAPHRITWSAAQAEKGGYPHFMLKEIHEQPRAVADTLRGRLDVAGGRALLDGVIPDPASIKRVLLLGCGTSYHAGVVGKLMIESLARVAAEVDLASEFRYRDPVIGPGDLVVAISQSGETADTLAAVKEAQARGARVVSICNVVDAAIPRLSNGALYTHAGPEIGVASTKCFTTQLAALALFALDLGRRTGALGDEAARAFAAGLDATPVKMQQVLERAGDLAALARSCAGVSDFLFLGRGVNYPIALEGALKLKEISYIHAEGYAAGEMKHGPIALIDEGIPVVVIAPQGPGYEKVLSNLAEVKAREGRVIAVGTEGDTLLASQCEQLLGVPAAPPLLQPLLTVLPLQLLAYGVARARGNDVDQPRNLAKSVTVE
jgi:glucosamine--fructose-6-phosphate aminotransferase (isomerizing)